MLSKTVLSRLTKSPCFGLFIPYSQITRFYRFGKYCVAPIMMLNNNYFMVKLQDIHEDIFRKKWKADGSLALIFHTIDLRKNCLYENRVHSSKFPVQS